jgi:hypothetical protein
LHNGDEGGNVLDEKSSSLETLFWLAEGFLPSLQGNEMVYSLEDSTLYPHQLHYLEKSTTCWTVLLIRTACFISGLIPIVWSLKASILLVMTQESRKIIAGGKA